MKTSAVIATLVVLYTGSYVCLRASQVLFVSTGWSCVSTRPPVSHVRGPAPLESLYQPLSGLELSLPLRRH